MRKIKKVSILLGTLMTLSLITGCTNTGTKGNKIEEVGIFRLNYDSKIEVDKVLCEVDEYKIELTPMHDDKKVKSGYSSTLNGPKNKDSKYSIKILNEDKVLFEVKDKSVDLSSDKSATITIIDDKEGFGLKIVNN